MHLTHDMGIMHSDINCVNHSEHYAIQVIQQEQHLYPVCGACCPDANGGETVNNTVIIFHELTMYADVVYLN